LKADNILQFNFFVVILPKILTRLTTMKKKTTIAITTQKGGCAKSTTTMIVASIFHYMLGKKVAVVDYDNQSSITKVRHRELEILKQSSSVANAFIKQDIPVYEVVQANPEAENALALTEIISVFDDDVDYIFFDYPGTVTQKILDDYKLMDAIIVPFTFSELDFESSFDFIANFIDEWKIEPKLFSIFFTKVDRQLTNWQKLLLANQATFDDLGIERFEAFIPQLKVFNTGLSDQSYSPKRRIDFLRSTILLPSESDLERSNYLDFAKELLVKLENIQ